MVRLDSWLAAGFRQLQSRQESCLLEMLRGVFSSCAGWMMSERSGVVLWFSRWGDTWLALSCCMRVLEASLSSSYFFVPLVKLL